MTRTYAVMDQLCEIVVERYDDDWASEANIIVSQGTQRSSRRLSNETIKNLMHTLGYIYKARTGELPTFPDGAEMLQIKKLDANKEDKLYLDSFRQDTPVTRVRTRQREPQTPPAVQQQVFRQRSRNT